MTADTITRLRTRHVEALALVSESENLLACTLAVFECDTSLQGKLALAYARLAVSMARSFEAECREQARETYWPKPEA